MPLSIIQRLNKYLQTLKPFTNEYKEFIGDENKIIGSPINNVNDYNIGSISNVLMWLEGLQPFLIKQMNINEASGKWLTRLKKWYGVKRDIGETDNSYRERLKKILIHVKESPLAIENIIDEYADKVEVIDGIEDGMFDNVSFDNYYISENYYISGNDKIQIKAAIDSGGIHGQPYYFRVLVTNPDTDKLKTIAYLVFASHVAGTYYDIFIIS